MGTVLTIVILVVVGLIAWSFFSTEINASLDDVNSFLRDSSVSIDKPSDGSPVYDLQADVHIKAKGTSNFGLVYVLFLNEDGGKFSHKWINPHLYRNSLLSFLAPTSLIDYFNYRNDGTMLTDLATNEIILIPNSGAVPVNFKLSYVLVDPDTGYQKKLSKYQDIPFSIPALVSTYSIDTKLVFNDMPKKNYELWIIPSTANYSADIRFADHGVGERYVQKISG